MVQCSNCDGLFIRKDTPPTFFCLTKRDYLKEINKEITCEHYEIIAKKAPRKPRKDKR